MKKLKYDKDELIRVCTFAFRNESKKGTPLIDRDGTELTLEKCIQEHIDLFEKNENFIRDFEKLTKKSLIGKGRK